MNKDELIKYLSLPISMIIVILTLLLSLKVLETDNIILFIESLIIVVLSTVYMSKTVAEFIKEVVFKS